MLGAIQIEYSTVHFREADFGVLFRVEFHNQHFVVGHISSEGYVTFLGHFVVKGDIEVIFDFLDVQFMLFIGFMGHQWGKLFITTFKV